MDLRKVFDQTVRDLKREVNKKVLKVPEIEQKVLDATSNEAWGPHGTAMAELAQATRNYNDFQMIMSVLWRRVADTGKNWRHVYKSLTVFDYLVAHGADRVIEELRENVYQLQGLVDFQYVEPTGKDQGINVRKKAQSLVSLLNDKDKIREARQKAAANRDKYQGYSSTGRIFKPSSYSSTGGRGFNDWDDDKNGYKDEKHDRLRSAFSDDERDEKSTEADKSFKPTTQNKSEKKDSGPPPKLAKSSGDEDDFDPRSSAAPAPPRAAEVDLISELDFFSAPASTVDPFETKTAPASDPFGSSEPFGSADDFGAFTSAPPTSSIPAGKPAAAAADDLFGGLSDLQFESQAAQKQKPLEFDAFPPPAPKPSSFSSSSFDAFSSSSQTATFDAFGGLKSSSQATSSFDAFSGVKSSSFDPFSGINSSQASSFDPFAGVSSTPATFEAFSGSSAQASMNVAVEGKASSQASFDAFGDFKTADTSSSAFPDIKAAAAAAAAPPKPSGFQAKSSVWADSLASGLIDLNITAPKSSETTGLQSNLGPDWFMDDKARAGSSNLGSDWFSDANKPKAAAPSTNGSGKLSSDWFMDDAAFTSGSSAFGR